MAALVYRCLFSLGNFFGIFSFSRDQRSLKISKFKVLLNFLKAFIPQSLFCFICVSSSAQTYIYGTDLSNLTEFSVFSLIIFGIQFILEQFVASVLIILHLLKRKKILQFFNRVSRLKISSKLEKEMKSRIKKVLLVAYSFAVTTNMLLMISSIELSLARVLIFLVTNLPFYVYFSFMIFIKISEIYLETLLKDVRRDLREASQKRGSRNLQRISMRYQVIVSMTDEFHSVFGASMSLEFCYLALKTTADVRIHKFNFFC